VKEDINPVAAILDPIFLRLDVHKVDRCHRKNRERRHKGPSPPEKAHWIFAPSTGAGQWAPSVLLHMPPASLERRSFAPRLLCVGAVTEVQIGQLF
jgi:hypothetical protein